LVLAVAVAMPRGSKADEPQHPSPEVALSAQIDRLLQPAVAQIASDREADGTLLRRLSLDLRGVVPTRQELDAFAAEGSADRWVRWVDQFLQDPLCDEHLVNFLDRTLMLRRGHSQVDRASWISYLREHVAGGTPLDALSRELLYTPWWNRDQRAAQRFYLDRGGDPHLITRDLARVFLGRDLQCAQCHDHPLVADFRQVDYHGLLAFVSAGSLAEATFKDAEGKDQKVQLYVEKAAGDAPFESVFERGTLLRSGTRLMDQPEQFDEYHLPDQRYLSEAPAGALAGAPLPPKSSRREQLAQRLADRGNTAFVANWANRLWALVYGQGLVHPVDMIHPDNPPIHPELFQRITDGLRQTDMQVKPFLRQLVISEAYQRGASPELLQRYGSPGDPALTELRKQLDQDSVAVASQLEALRAVEAAQEQAHEAAREAWLKIQADRTAVRAELDTAEAAMLDAKKKQDEASAAVAVAQQKLTDSQTRAALLDESAAKLQQALTLAGGQDAELAQAIALASQRAEAARAQSPELEKAVADTQTAAAATAAAYQQATATVSGVVERLNPIHFALRAADEASVAARATWAKTRSDRLALQQALNRSQHLIEWIAELARAEGLSKSIAAAEANIAATEVETSRLLAAIEATRSALASNQQSLQSSQEELAQATQTLQQQQAGINTLQQSLDSLGEAVKLASNTATLVAASDSLRVEMETRRSELGMFQAAIDNANVKLAAQLATLSQTQAELDTQLAGHQQQAQQLTSLQGQRDEQLAQLETTRTNLQQQAQIISRDRANQLADAGLYPLTAEQMCWSTLRITGVLDAYIGNELAELEKQAPLPADADDATRAKRQQQAVRQAIEKLRGNADHYVSLYASGPDKTQDDYFASADQALYVANGGSVFNWAAPGNHNPTQAAAEISDPAEIARLLYWSYLCRQPTPEETAMVSEQLAAAGDQRNAVLQEMAWSLLASAEFRFSR
jgi:hypothetical protein